MRSSSKNIIAKAMLVSVIGLSSNAFADSKWYDTVNIGGYVQGSYVGNLQASDRNTTNQSRQFDTASNSFGLNTALLSIMKPVGDDHYGFNVRLRTGNDANILAGGTGAGQLFVQEAYATYALPFLSKLSVTGGKFVTPVGFEGADTVMNPNFSEGLLFTFAEPVTHTGVKANYVFNDKVNSTLGVVNGWDGTTDNNQGKTILWQVATAPAKNVSWSFQGLYGPELASTNANSHGSKRLSLDTVVSVTPCSKSMLALQANYGQETKNLGRNHWSGLGVWASYATTDKFTEIVRFEVLKDQNNAGRVTAGTNQTVKEITLTHKTMLTSALGTRLEYRHDWSNMPTFVRKDGSAVRNQNTISLDWFVLF